MCPTCNSNPCNCHELHELCPPKPPMMSGKVTKKFLDKLNNSVEKYCGWPKSVYKEAYE